MKQNVYVGTQTHVKHKSIRVDIPPEQVIRTEHRNRWQHSMYHSTLTGDKIHTRIIETEHRLLLSFLPTLTENKCTFFPNP